MSAPQSQTPGTGKPVFVGRSTASHTGVESAVHADMSAPHREGKRPTEDSASVEPAQLDKPVLADRSSASFTGVPAAVPPGMSAPYREGKHHTEASASVEPAQLDVVDQPEQRSQADNQFAENGPSSPVPAHESQRSIQEPLLNEKKKKKILVVGNPRRGKSTFCNRLARANAFRAGLATGKGMTDKVNSLYVERIGYTLVDTIGVDDNDDELHMAAEDSLSDELRNGGDYKILVMIAPVHGGIEESDRALLKLVLEAVPGLKEREDGYGIIVNGCPPTMEEKARDDSQWRKEFLSELFRGFVTTTHVFFYLHNQHLFGKESADVDFNSDYVRLSEEEERVVREVPDLHLDAGCVGKIHLPRYGDAMRDLEEARGALQGEKANRLERDMADREANKHREKLKASTNAKLAFGGIITLMLLSIPAMLCVAQVPMFARPTLATVRLWRGRFVSLQTWLFPYLAIVIAYKAIDVTRSFSQTHRARDIDRFIVFGRAFRVWNVDLQQWHTYIALQAADFLSDVDCCIRETQHATDILVPLAWYCTTFVSLVIPAMYFAGFVKFERALLLELVLEDIAQSGLCVRQLFLVDNDVPLSLISSTILAVLGVFGTLGILDSILRRIV